MKFNKLIIALISVVATGVAIAGMSNQAATELAIQSAMELKPCSQKKFGFCTDGANRCFAN